MTILVENEQSIISLTTEWVEQRIMSMLKALGLIHFSVNIRITDNAGTTHFNKKFRKKNEPTDILSFPFFTDLKAGQMPEPTNDDEYELGDIIISMERVERDSADLKISSKEHLTRLLAHGIAHLLGYRHKTESEHKKMANFEQKLITASKTSTNNLQ